MSLLKACHGILSNIQENYALPGPHVIFAEKKQTAQLNGLFTGHGLRRMLNGTQYHEADMVFSFVASIFDKNVGFESFTDLIRLHLQNSSIRVKVQVDHKEFQFIEREHLRLSAEIEELKRIFKKHLRRFARLGCLR